MNISSFKQRCAEVGPIYFRMALGGLAGLGLATTIKGLFETLNAPLNPSQESDVNVFFTVLGQSLVPLAYIVTQASEDQFPAKSPKDKV